MSGAVTILQMVHATPGVERATLVRTLGLPSGFAAETIARLTEQQLLEERPAAPTGGRGRPTTELRPHRDGPLVAVAAIAHEQFTVVAAELGGSLLASSTSRHSRDVLSVLAAVRTDLARLRRRFGRRIAVVAISVPGTVHGGTLVYAPGLNWHDIELAPLWSNDRHERTVIAGNDATFAAVAEARRGSGAGFSSVLHLYMDSGIGGGVIEHGRVLAGANGMAGEFGHLPFGDPARQCPCGAFGCWGTMLDGSRLAELLGDDTPRDDVSYARSVVERARGNDSDALDALGALGGALGRGAAGLVNAFDPAVVSLGGLGRDLVELVPAPLNEAYLAGMMRFRAVPAPLLRAATFGPDASIVGAVEEAFTTVLSDDGIRRWTDRR